MATHEEIRERAEKALADIVSVDAMVLAADCLQLLAEIEQEANPYRKPGPFASLRDMVYTECPCGCGSKEVCEAQRAKVETHNKAIPF